MTGNVYPGQIYAAQNYPSSVIYQVLTALGLGKFAGSAAANANSFLVSVATARGSARAALIGLVANSSLVAFRSAARATLNPSALLSTSVKASSEARTTVSPAFFLMSRAIAISTAKAFPLMFSTLFARLQGQTQAPAAPPKGVLTLISIGQGQGKGKSPVELQAYLATLAGTRSSGQGAGLFKAPLAGTATGKAAVRSGAFPVAGLFGNSSSQAFGQTSANVNANLSAQTGAQTRSANAILSVVSLLHAVSATATAVVSGAGNLVVQAAGSGAGRATYFIRNLGRLMNRRG